MQANRNLANMLHIQALVLQLAPVAMSVFERPKAIGPLESREARGVSGSQTTKKGSECLIQATEYLLHTSCIEQAKILKMQTILASALHVLHALLFSNIPLNRFCLYTTYTSDKITAGPRGRKTVKTAVPR